MHRNELHHAARAPVNCRGPRTSLQEALPLQLSDSAMQVGRMQRLLGMRVSIIMQDILPIQHAPTVGAMQVGRMRRLPGMRVAAAAAAAGLVSASAVSIIMQDILPIQHAPTVGAMQVERMRPLLGMSAFVVTCPHRTSSAPVTPIVVQDVLRAQLAPGRGAMHLGRMPRLLRMHLKRHRHVATASAAQARTLQELQAARGRVESTSGDRGKLRRGCRHAQCVAGGGGRRHHRLRLRRDAGNPR